MCNQVILALLWLCLSASILSGIVAEAGAHSSAADELTGAPAHWCPRSLVHDNSERCGAAPQLLLVVVLLPLVPQQEVVQLTPKAAELCLKRAHIALQLQTVRAHLPTTQAPPHKPRTAQSPAIAPPVQHTT